MRKKILFTCISVLVFFIICISFLSIYGIKTDSFNNFINNKVKEYNSKLTLQIDKVYIKLNLNERAININTKNAILIANSNSINISNIDINLNLIKFLKQENSIKNIKIKSSNNLIKDVISFFSTIKYDLSRYILYSQIKKGSLSFELDTNFNNLNQNNFYYFISGSVNDAELNIPDYENLDDINFNFEAQNKLTEIFNLNFNFQNLNFSSKNLEIKEEKSGEYNIKGNIENSKALINPILISKLINIKQDYLSNKDIIIKSKNSFSFKFTKKKKIKNIKIDSEVSFNEIYFNEKYKSIIFLKEGTINSKLENEQFTANLQSNFAFYDDLKLNNDFKNNNLKLFLKSENSKKIKINGSINNGKILIEPKIFFSLLNLDSQLLSKKKVNVVTDNKFKFEVNNGKIENYLIASNINFDKLEFNKEVQDIVYLKNLKTKLSIEDDLLNIDLKSNYSFFDKNLNNDSDKNIFNFKYNKSKTKISDLEIFIKTDNNKINTKEIQKLFNFQKIDHLINDQIINLNSNFNINLSIDDKFNFKKITIRSDINFDNLNINYNSNLVKKYIRNYEDKLKIKNPKILFEYAKDKIKFQLDGKYLFKDKEDDIFIKFNSKKNNFELYSLLNLDNSVLKFDTIEYFKEKNVPSKLEILVNKFENGLKFEKIRFLENKNYIFFKNLFISNNFKIQSADIIDVNFFNKNKIKNNFKIKKNLNKYNLSGSQIDGEKIVERLLKSNNKKFIDLFDDINTLIIFNLDKIYLEKDEYLKKFVGEFNIKNNKLILAKANAVLAKDNKFSYSYRTTTKNEKITNIAIEEPKAFINNYKFIKGFEEGELKLNSKKIGNISRSNLKITNFKVKEVPILAKILTLASLQGIADLLTGEGIRFDKFEMDFKTKNNFTEIEEMYAVGPAISIMLEGYIEKDRLTSLKGTLVPATTINKTLAKIPLIGNILVGGKTGEGVFGVSFKIKGPPDDLKSTVNPIKTLTPRFITRTLENLKGN
tara:strand:+ start:7958 stop:10933 length:2976 start_codon:yes stop_codon:yes gene_type:complete